MNAKEAHSAAVATLEVHPLTIKLLKLIETRASSGKFSFSSKLEDEMDDLIDVCKYLEHNGYSARVVPGNASHTVYISW